MIQLTDEETELMGLIANLDYEASISHRSGHRLAGRQWVVGAVSA
jgi:hypothetical protein